MDEQSSLYDNIDLYDTMVWGSCEQFYLDAARAANGPVLELASGTGRMLIPMLEAGVDIEGIDISPIMIQAARNKAASKNLHLRLEAGDMRCFRRSRKYELIFIAINSLLHLSRVEDLRQCFASVREALLPNGRFIFDILNVSAFHLPTTGARRLFGYYPDTKYGTLRVEEVRRYNPDTQLMHFTLFYSGNYTPDFHSNQYSLRVLPPDELEALLRLEGLRLVERFGSLERDVFGADSPSQVCIVKLAGYA